MTDEKQLTLDGSEVKVEDDEREPEREIDGLDADELPEQIGPFDLEWREETSRDDVAMYVADDDAAIPDNFHRISVWFAGHPQYRHDEAITVFAQLDDSNVLDDGWGYITPDGFKHGGKTMSRVYDLQGVAREVMVNWLREYVDSAGDEDE